MNRRIIAVLAAVVLAAVGAGAVLLYVRSADNRAVAGKQARTVLVAEKLIPAGTNGRALRDGGYLRQTRMPAETVPDDTLATVEGDLDALVTTAAVQRGQLLMRTMFGTAVNRSGLAIPDGKLAISAKVKSAVFGPGAVRAGTRVAIFYTYTPVAVGKLDEVSGSGLERGRDVNNVTRLLMTDIEVISVGAAAGEGDGEVARPATATTGGGDVAITFALDQRQAEILAHATALGGLLNVGLLGDSSDVRPDRGVDNGSLFGKAG
ncbi:RcpC/CpaB family pilus assembly protein [Asanoa sp. WMMD1127]|uniref:RcpC/CpaB family pilus assembly protein n=1 Tax=Asanoa sp. WMMD1127 TaxID=3016107 RepID=UPI00241641A3|nr:RcpC/CpaB family pilus assembly protein [Asanoa sp. WMMD1127]MDG4823924.1 RcpC/CpaB family pilus assembly protein [Asanoa sp. WMMD1127]